MNAGQFLLALGADLDVTDEFSSSVLHLAARSGQFATVHALLHAGAQLGCVVPDTVLPDTTHPS